MDTDVKYVWVIERSYILAIKDTGITLCKSRLRARQFNSNDITKLQKILKGHALQVTWDQ